MYELGFDRALSSKAQIFLYLSTILTGELNIIHEIYNHSKQSTLEDERDFQYYVSKKRKHKHELLTEDSWMRNKREWEFFSTFMSISIRNESHIHYHPRTNSIENMKTRYSSFFENGIPWHCPCEECNYYQKKIECAQHVDKQIAHKYWNDTNKLPVNENGYVYNRIRNGCKMCKHEAFICDYCCKGLPKKKSGKYCYLKYNYGARCGKLKTGPLGYDGIQCNEKLLNDFVVTHKTPPKLFI